MTAAGERAKPTHLIVGLLLATVLLVITVVG
jgi:hypothetical protein